MYPEMYMMMIYLPCNLLLDTDPDRGTLTATVFFSVMLVIDARAVQHTCISVTFGGCQFSGWLVSVKDICSYNYKTNVQTAAMCMINSSSSTIS
jgi:hypothetical protein